MVTPIFGRCGASHAMMFSAAFLLAAATAHAGEAQLSVSDVSVSETAGNLDFNVVRSGDTSGDIVVPYTLAPETATAGSDYNAPASGVLHIPAGLTQDIVSVPIVNDTQSEGNETLSLQLGSPTAFGSAAGFVGPPTIAIGAGRHDVVVADFDGDGMPDIATANTTANNVSVVLHDASGAFIPASNYAVGSSPTSVAAGDFNGDGKPDLVAANRLGSTVSVLINDGTGNFLPAAAYSPGGSNPETVVVADFNADGKPDLAVARPGNKVAVLLNNGSGAFPIPVDYTVPVGLTSVATGDFNGDGKPDLVTVSWNGSGFNTMNFISMLLNDGSGGFLPAVNRNFSREPDDIVTADFDGDGNLDVAVPIGGIREIEFQFGDGAGGFTASKRKFVGTNVGFAQFPYVADINGDGKPDLVLSDAEHNNVAVLLNDGSGGFPATTGGIGYATGTNVSGVAAGDFNGDGKADLVAANTSSLMVLYQDSGGFHSPVVSIASPVSVAAADFNGDGKPDVATAGANGATVVLNDGSGDFLDPVNYGVGGGTPQYVVAADLDGDGKPDLATTNSDGTVTLEHNDGSGHFSIAGRYPVGSEAGCATVADFDDDTRADLAVANFGSQNVSVLRSDGLGGFLAAVNYALSAPNGALCVTAADLNGDGKPDLAVGTANRNINTGTFAGKVAILMNDGSGGFLAPVFYPVRPKPVSIVAADFTGDGKLDLGVAPAGDTSSSISAISVLRNDGSGGFLPASDWSSRGVPVGVVAADFNGDGKPDLGVANQDGDDVAVLLNNGSGGFPNPTGYAAGGLASAVAAADFNSDGKPDLAVASNNGNNLVVLLNAPTNTAVLSDGSAIGTIVDDDGTPTVSFDTAGAVYNETASTVMIPVRLSAPSALEVRAAFAVSGSATAADFNSTTSSPLVFPPNSTAVNIVLSIAEDTLDEDSETVIFTLGALTNATAGSLPAYTATIQDNDDAPTVKFTAATQNVGEAAGTAAVSLQLSGPSGKPVTVPLSFGGTASRPGDYNTAVSSVTIPAGDLSGGFSLSIVNDTIFESPDENILVSAGNPSNATLASPSSQTLTIIDDEDVTPDDFSFTDVTNVALNSVQTSNTVTVTGINTATPISVSGGTYSIGCTGTFTAAAGTINSGQTVCVRHTAAAALNTAVNTMLTIGSVSDTFTSTSTTLAADTTPNQFTFMDQTNVPRNSVRTSNAVTISGITAPAAISIMGGGYSIGCTGTFTTAAGTISNGQTVCVRHTSASTFNTGVNTILTVGGVSDTFTTVTAPNAVTALLGVSFTVISGAVGTLLGSLGLLGP
ncbi:MAG: beta strand repeat-containing protein [Panacagrimonas sp.]